MKTSVKFFCRNARRRLVWLALLLLTATPTFATLTDGSFVEGLLTVGSRSVDVQVDNSVGTPWSGTTYVLGRDDSSHAFLTLLDQSGATIYTNTISGITPAGMAVVPGTNAVYLVGGSVVMLVNATNGAIISQVNLLSGGAGLSLKSVYWDSVSNALYVCGNYSGVTTTDAFGNPLTVRGTQAAVASVLSPDLSQEFGLTTFGCTGSGAKNTANSIVVDESGEVFVAGHLDSGNFQSDSLSANAFNLTETYQSSFWAVFFPYVSSIQAAINLLNNPYLFGVGTSTTVHSSPSTIDFSGTAPNRDARRYAGYFFAPSAGRYIFYNNSDDGARLSIDGNMVINDDANHGPLTTAYTNTFTAGLHYLEYIYFNGVGGSEGHVKWHVPTDTATDYASAVLVPAANFGSSEGYVLKFSHALDQVQGFYSSSAASNQGGELNELAYKSGFVYGIGNWVGSVDTNMTGAADTSYAGSANVEIIKLDTDLKLKKRATVKNTHNINGYGITVDDLGNVYVSGSHGPASSDLFGSSDSASQPSKSISASQPSIFMAQLNASLNFQWVQSPGDPQPTFDFASSVPRTRWSTALQRAYWFGHISGGALILGNPSTRRTISDGNEAFLALLEPNGQFAEQVLLTLYADYGTVSPFGGYPSNSASNFVDGFNRKLVIKGSQVAASVPSVIYLDLGANNVADDTLDQAETRITCTGYTVGENVANGTANNYTFTVAQDSIVRFNFIKEYALRIDSDLSDTTRADWPGVGLYSAASGGPNPTVQKHWVKAGDPVIAAVDSAVDDQTFLSQGLNVRYAVDSYQAYGPARSDYATVPGSLTNRYAFIGSDARWQIPQFTMSAPSGIKYHWKLRLGVQVATSGLKSATYPCIQYVSDLGGGTNSGQGNGLGSGTFFYDYGTVLNIGSVLNQGTTQLQGWLNGDGAIFGGTGGLGDLNGSFTLGSTNYSALQVSLTRPARVLWNYGDRIFNETVTLGNTVTFSTVDDPVIAANLQKYLPPVAVQVISGPQGSSANDMALWDDTGKKYYPLRPGVVMSYWQTTSTDTNDRVILRLTFQYPATPHYRHIANTRGVPLNASNSPSAFVGVKYTESSTGAAVDNATNFTATGPGRTVMLFSETSSSGRGGKIVSPRVRVVQTANWNDNLPATQTAVIGKKITSSYDTSGLGTGYLFFPNARYNAAIYDRNNLSGPIIPVNLNPTAGANDQLVVVWYETRDQILWPYQAVRYQPAWPTNAAQGLNRIVIASRYGNESVAADGTDQFVVPAETYGTNAYAAETTFNPARFSSVKIYNQPNRTLPGFNPNEEHALLAPSLRSAAISPQPAAVYALRIGDLNATNRDATYTSDPYVLVQFYDNIAQENRMAVYTIVAAASNRNLGTNSYDYSFTQQMTAGEPVIPFYPLPQVIGATPSSSTYGRDGQPTKQICFWKDHKNGGWAISGNSFFDVYYYYPLSPDFWWPAAGKKNPGDGVAFLPNQPGYAAPAFAINYTRNDQTPAAQGIHYTTVWPLDVPILKVGETLTFAGGEYQLDNPTTASFDDQGNLVQSPTPGLPGVVGFAAGQVVFDTMNPVMDDQLAFDHYTARIFPALEERVVSLPVAQFPTPLLPANGRSTVQNGLYIFNQLPSSLQKRIFYDPIRAVLGIKGFLNDKDISDSTLTASPPAVYCLEPNILTTYEKNILDGSDNKSPFADIQGTPFAAAMDALFNLSRNPNQLDQSGNGVDAAYRVGLEQEVKRDPSTGLPLTTTSGTVITVQRDATKAMPMQALGPGLALTANGNFLDPANTNVISYVTVAENNSDALGSAPVALHIIKVDKTERYRGSIKTILSANAFDENITLRHTADFGGNADDLVFEWWYRPADGTDALPPDRDPSPWKLFSDPSGNLGRGFYQLVLKGDPSAPQVLLGDTWFYLRYRHKNETVNGVNWEVVQPNGEKRNVLGSYADGIPYDWIGAGNSSPTTDFNVPGEPDYLAQLAEGWIKRVMTAVNPYETRIKDFTQNAPMVYSSIIQQLGAAYTGPVALNSDPNVLQNVGLIQLYQTILQRGEDLSINLSTPICDNSIANALELASTRISEFYLLLGNEAYSDSMNPAIGYGSGLGNDLSGAGPGYGAMEPNILAFQNQLSTRLDEELGLLRGLAANNGLPVFNRLYWNFTHAEGEAAYVMKYNITDVNNDGVIDVKDAITLYPQGHGDAWGHYLTAERMSYDLLRHPYFNWVSRSEYINSQDVVIPVDYLDERNFAKIAAAKAEAGAQVLNLTYRQKYVADPRGQWQGYLDTDSAQAWGVDEWARRAGQGALFDWVTANALLPAVHPNTNYTGIQKVDRTTVTDISSVAANFRLIQDTMDQADGGNNPLGLHKGALSFAVDLTQGSYFNQTYTKAVAALNNALAQFNNANQFNNLIRQVATSQAELQNAVREQDLSYRNQLIEIFGTPYAGTIGSGKLYPAGYLGPDLALYNYVNVNSVNDSTVPQPSLAYASALQAQTGGGASIYQHSAFVDTSGWQQQFNLTILNGQANTINSSDFASGSVPNDQVLQNMQLPIMADGYSYVAPPAWGQRGSVGQLQKNIGDMVQAQADLIHEVNVWQQISTDIINKLTYMNQKFEWDNTSDNLKIAKGSLDIVFDTTKGALELAKTISDYLGSRDIAKIADAAEGFIPTSLPTAGLSFSPGDALAPARGAINLAAAAGQLVTDGLTVGIQAASFGVDLAKAISDISFDTSIDHITAKEELLNSLYEVQSLVKQESDQRLAVFKAVQALKGAGDDYRTTLANGIRLIQERSNYNKKVAVQNQQAQYQDFTFRFSRNTALEQYRSAFDLASRYAYLAASAYDYDLNLGPDDSGSPLGIMADIIRQRSIGYVDATGTPQVGGKGLAEDLAKLNANYQVLSSRMGLLNPIQENQTISLRASLFELGSETNDTAWFNKLSTYYVSNLWTVPEFRRYCRPFAPETNGPQPGLVIPFCSVIKSGQNFFNQPLGPNPDVAYDPSVYSTRIASVGVSFNNYNGYINGQNTPMSASPRAYLIPVGADVMTIPNDPNLNVRYWNVCDQNIPLPYPATSANFSNPDWRPFIDSVTGSSGTFGDIRQYSSFLANANNSYWYYINNYTNSPSFPNVSQRLIGRSVWNTQWLLVIPGASLLNDPEAGIEAFLKTVDDIQLNISTYGYSGN